LQINSPGLMADQESRANEFFLASFLVVAHLEC